MDTNLRFLCCWLYFIIGAPLSFLVEEIYPKRIQSFAILPPWSFTSKQASVHLTPQNFLIEHTYLYSHPNTHRAISANL